MVLMNTTSPLRLTPAAYLLIVTLITCAATVVSFKTNLPWFYLGLIPLTGYLMFITGESMMKHSKTR